MNTNYILLHIAFFPFTEQAEGLLSPYFLNEVISHELQINIQVIKTHSL